MIIAIVTFSLVTLRQAQSLPAPSAVQIAERQTELARFDEAEPLLNQSVQTMREAGPTSSHAKYAFVLASRADLATL